MIKLTRRHFGYAQARNTRKECNHGDTENTEKTRTGVKRRLSIFVKSAIPPLRALRVSVVSSPLVLDNRNDDCPSGSSCLEFALALVRGLREGIVGPTYAIVGNRANLMAEVDQRVAACDSAHIPGAWFIWP